nr:hypothetical protein [Hyphobacterium sp. CCMP332]
MVPRIGNALGLQPARQFQRRLPAELHDHAVQRSVLLLDAQDLHDMLERSAARNSRSEVS